MTANTLRERARQALVQRTIDEQAMMDRQRAEDEARLAAAVSVHLEQAKALIKRTLGHDLTVDEVVAGRESDAAQDELGFGVLELMIDGVRLGLACPVIANRHVANHIYQYLLYALADCTRDDCVHPNAPVQVLVTSLADLGYAIERFAGRDVQHPMSEGDCRVEDWG